jgi:hypothetical protein
VPIFLVETYLTLGTAHGRAERDRGAEQAADALTREGTTARFAGSIHIPADEICFFAFDTAASEDAELVAKRAGLDPLRVVHAVAPALRPPNQTHHHNKKQEHP